MHWPKIMLRNYQFCSSIHEVTTFQNNSKDATIPRAVHRSVSGGFGPRMSVWSVEKQHATRPAAVRSVITVSSGSVVSDLGYFGWVYRVVNSENIHKKFLALRRWLELSKEKLSSSHRNRTPEGVDVDGYGRMEKGEKKRKRRWWLWMGK